MEGRMKNIELRGSIRRENITFEELEKDSRTESRRGREPRARQDWRGKQCS